MSVSDALLKSGIFLNAGLLPFDQTTARSAKTEARHRNQMPGFKRPSLTLRDRDAVR